MGTVRVGLPAETGMVSQHFDAASEVVQTCGKTRLSLSLRVPTCLPLQNDSSRPASLRGTKRCDPRTSLAGTVAAAIPREPAALPPHNFVLPLSMAMFTLRFAISAAEILRGKRDLVVASHKVVDEIEDRDARVNTAAASIPSVPAKEARDV